MRARPRPRRYSWGSSRCCSRRGRRCRRPSWHVELINFVVVGHVNATASHHAAVPFACASHQFVVSTTSKNKGAGITIVTVQLLITLGADNPYDYVVGSIGRGDPRRPLAALAHVPSGDYRGWICRSNLIGLYFTTSGAKD